ncbi:hypothetical protein [Actinoallomurus sp. NPDC052274]|uniref:hypothetical protein n=1 Tax=Actinoallomurus sp. NPDC052274 TaxID=3155420 RepID=UPI0034334CEE
MVEDDLLQVVRSGPFDVALQAAIQARGLTLETLQRRLRERRVHVSLSSLSYWQRGRTRPGRADSLRAVRGLESILELPRNSLITLLKPPDNRPAGTWSPPAGIFANHGALDLLDEIGDRTDGRITCLSLHDRYVLGPDRDLRSAQTRAVLQAQQPGVDRWLCVYHNEHGVLPTYKEASRCRFGRIRTDEAKAMVASELLFDRPLARGETYLIEYGFGFSPPGPPDTEEGRGFRFPQHEYLLEIEFHPSTVPARCYRTWRPDGAARTAEETDLRLSSAHTVHVIEFGLQAGGYLGIGWEWD